MAIEVQANDFNNLISRQIAENKRYNRIFSMARFYLDNGTKLEKQEKEKAIRSMRNSLATLRASDVYSLVDPASVVFFIILPETSLNGAVTVIERLRASISLNSGKVATVEASDSPMFSITEYAEGDSFEIILERLGIEEKC